MSAESTDEADAGIVEKDGQEYIDRDSVDFDPDEGLLSGTAIKGGTKIPGPHEHVDDVTDDEEKVDDPTESSATF